MQTGNGGALRGLRRVTADRGGIGMGYIKDQVNSVITAKAGKSRFPAKPASMRWNTRLVGAVVAPASDASMIKAGSDASMAITARASAVPARTSVFNRPLFTCDVAGHPSR